VNIESKFVQATAWAVALFFAFWSASKLGRAARIGHGVRCLEDATLAQYLRNQQIPLEVCPSSNVCLRVVRDLADHPLPQLMAEGLYVTINTDDPPMFNTTLNDELIKIARQFGWRVSCKEFCCKEVMKVVNS
jgi:aminodeoxyfutalosine deaminase